ncbi:hypothetical protein ELH21_09335 [Rhizobium leguminosarum]|uniref:hypothetical protein n=1 Tax=Rhizobium leguminosarum TaxID=384 RepID=UPI0010320428|nr:hypothetical protein [Rhizobium leguminosarum]TBD04581.1 hypothetical protein ELH21_09335 [Rhizobium leguminosarum]
MDRVDHDLTTDEELPVQRLEADPRRAPDPPVRWLLVRFNFVTWEPDNKHWVAPSSLDIFSDGTLVFKARHLAAMYRNPGPIDDGPSYRFCFGLNLWKNNTILTRIGMCFAELAYRQPADNIVLEITRPDLKPRLLQADSANGQRTIEKIEGGFSGEVQFPPIPF